MGGVVAHGEIDPLALTQLTAAYQRRAAWEAELQALETVKWLGKALDGGSSSERLGGSRANRRRPGKGRRERVATDYFLGVAGKEIEA